MEKKEIGAAVGRERAAQQLTQQQLADKAGIRRQAIIEIEQDQYGYRVDRLIEVLDALGLTILVVKKDANVATMVSSVQQDSLEMLVFRGVKPLLQDPEQQTRKKKKKV